MMGCLSLSRWQTEDIEFAKKEVEQRASRIGSVLLCEDSFNQTTCICNRRDKCNSLHLNLPFSTYAEGFFNGIVNFDLFLNHSGYTTTFSSSSYELLLLAFLLFSLHRITSTLVTIHG
ncbi:hypothetical protein PRIPAC_88127 [Pristionchus pacificus]|uniref:Uncharacterized protein n=1 Tax=Pristionchus pacificus TaxID=54126 RepID=A0A2A6B6B3_PRIPA|nr:hypothetical protein PRIPAC_88127 [Pristionchus pacificus]|eukprot:PDM61391.1 hypothetical protein PRIPAC_50833 [Pristionchus pacificus]